MSSSSAGTPTPDTTDVSERLASMSVRDESPQRQSLEPIPSIKQEDASEDESNSSNATTPQTHSRTSSATPKLDGHAFRDSFMNSSTLGFGQAGIPERYDIGSEKEHLKLPFYSESFQTDLNFTRDTLQDLQQQMTDALKNNEDLSDMSEKIKDLCDEARATYTIGIVGGEQSGKSSLINSLLHIPDIAPVGGIERCITNVITEYHYAEDGQTCPIVVVSESMSESEVEAELAVLIEALHSNDQSVREATACYLCHIFFGNGVLTDWKAATIQNIIETVTAEQLLEYWKRDGPPSDLEWYNKRREFHNPTTADKTCSNRRRWPWMRTIKCFVHAEMLKDGLVIAEVPIFREYDAPFLSLHISNYLRNCNTILLSTTTLEAATTISTCEKRLGTIGFGKFKVICTKSDQLRVKEMRRLALKSTEDGYRRELEGLEEQINIQQAQQNHAKLELAKQRQMELLFKVRDEFLGQKLKRGPIGFGSFIMSVSNTKYDKYCEKGPQRRVADTGIPALRYYCRRLMADATLDVYRNTILPQTMGMVDDMKGLVPQLISTEETNQLTQLTETIARCREITENIKEWAEDTRQKCQSELCNITSSFIERHTGSWAAHALKVGERWQNQYMKAGSDDDTADYELWNRSFLEALEQPALAELLHKLEDLVEEQTDKFMWKFWYKIQSVSRKIQGIETTIFESQTVDYTTGIVRKFVKRTKATNHAIQQIHQKAINANEDSYIWELMTPVYDFATLLSKENVPRDVVGRTVPAYIRRESPCAGILAMMVRDLSCYFTREQKHLETACYSSLVLIQSIVQEQLDKMQQSSRLTQNLDEKLAKLKEISERINTAESSQSEEE